MRIILTTILGMVSLAALAGCSNEPETPPAQETSDVQASGATPQPEPAPTPQETAEPEKPVAAAGPGIPAAVQGRWGLVPADCEAGRSDAKGLMEIGPDKAEFYESVARLGNIKEKEPSRIRASFQFSGEGQTWAMDMVLDAQDGGKTLIRRDYGPDAMPGPLKYNRC